MYLETGSNQVSRKLGGAVSTRDAIMVKPQSYTLVPFAQNFVNLTFGLI